MNKRGLIIDAILFVAIVILFILHFTGSKPDNRMNFSSADDSTATKMMPIAYVNIDTLLSEYNYSIDLNEEMLQKRESAQATLNEKAKKLDKEMSEFQKKQENNAFLSEQSYKRQQKSLIRQQKNLQELDKKLTNELVAEQQEMNKKLRDTIYKFLEQYNKEKKYQIIFSNTMNDNIMLADKAYDITNEIVELLNDNYVKQDD